MAHPEPAPPPRWDRHAILAEVNRRGLSLTGIARTAGLSPASCRQALHGINRKGADALAAALGIPFDTLFPEGFVQSRRQASAKHLEESRQKRVRSADSAAAR